MFRDTQWIHDTKTKKKNNQTKRRNTDPPTSDTSSTSSSDKASQRSNEEVLTINSFYDPLPPSDPRNIEGGEYFLPSADKNIERLQMQHYLFSKCVWRSNYSSPLDETFELGGAKVLDVQ
jgi:hypothetical protein